jgi:hypothetical protein
MKVNEREKKQNERYVVPFFVHLKEKKRLLYGCTRIRKMLLDQRSINIHTKKKTRGICISDH